MSRAGSAHSAGQDRVESIVSQTVELPIPRPLQLGPMRIVSRRYTVVRVRTTDGVVGRAFALSRDAPIARVLDELVAPIVVGQPADAIAARWDDVYRQTVAVGRTGLVMRALSLVDVALWDIKGQRAGLPVWRLLGGDGGPVPCILVAGYPTGQGPEELADRLVAQSQRGHHLLKLARTPADRLRTTLERAADGLAAGHRLIVDAAWWWRTAAEAHQEILCWAGAAPLAWVEDPLVPEDVRAYHHLCASRVAPVGVGDELTDRHTAHRLLDTGIDVLRIDALAIGGITAAWHLSQVAAATGVPVSYHVYPETHVHLAAAGATHATVETFGPPDNPFDPARRLVAEGCGFGPGQAWASDRPGLGITLDDELVAAHELEARASS